MNRLANGGLAYRCNHCGKVDRKGRLVGHILRDHVPQDRVPFYCTLCRFRCETRDDCVKHLTKYAGHVRAAGNTPNVDLNKVLIKSGNPWFVSSSDLTQVPDEDDDMFADQDEQQLPTWLREVRPLKRKLNTPPGPVSAFSPVPTPAMRQVIARTPEIVPIAVGPVRFPELSVTQQESQYVATGLDENPLTALLESLQTPYLHQYHQPSPLSRTSQWTYCRLLKTRPTHYSSRSLPHQRLPHRQTA